jgi:hypothetical protein
VDGAAILFIQEWLSLTEEISYKKFGSDGNELKEDLSF